jgi:hypothetical protein
VAEPQSESKSWWQTIPGILTAVAAVITAVTGLVVALHQAGVLHRGASTQSETGTITRRADTAPHSTAAQDGQAGSKGNTESQPIAVPPHNRLKTDTADYELIAGHLERGLSGEPILRLAVRVTNLGRFPMNFWSDSFRLVFEDSLLAPSNSLDEVVAPQSTVKGDVEFKVPANISTVSLQMGEVGRGKPAIDIPLR